MTDNGDTHRARKRFGQNFLNDTSIIDRIIHAMRIKHDDAVIEVGPGLGALTLPLLDALDALTVVEIDRDLIARLRDRRLDGLTIHEGDALATDFTTLLVEPLNRKPLRLVGNLPYNIGTPLLLRWLDAHDAIQDIHVMLQKEVVDRLHAKPGNRAFGRLSVLLQSVFTIEPLFSVPPTAFTPAPKVKSAVVRLKPLADPPSAAELAALQRATRLAFANKRKTLRNNLKAVLDASEIEALDIDPGARAETLDLGDFQRLATRLEQG